MSNPFFRKHGRNLGLVAAGLVAGGILANGLSASAADNTGTSSGSSSASSSSAPTSAGTRPTNPNPGDQSKPQRSDETLLTGDIGQKVHDAVAAKYPGASFVRVETDSDGVYEAHITKADGTPVTVGVDKNFAVTGEEAGGAGHGGPGGHGGHGGPGGGQGRPNDNDADDTGTPGNAPGNAPAAGSGTAS